MPQSPKPTKVDFGNPTTKEWPFLHQVAQEETVIELCGIVSKLWLGLTSGQDHVGAAFYLLYEPTFLQTKIKCIF